MILKTRAEKRNAILKSQIEIARANADNFISDLAALIKDRDCPNLPADNIKLTLARGECSCRAALRLLADDN
jgi:hypothetical protein